MKKTNPKNEKIIKEYIAHLKLGKPVLNKKKKPIGDTTAKKITLWLRKISNWLDNKDFKLLTQKDIDDFRTKLKDDKIKQNTGKPYSKSTKRDIEYKIFRSFCCWLGKQELVYYTDNYNEQKEIPALSQKEVEKMINSAKLRDKVVLAVLFDGGFRIGEFMNITFNDIKDDELKSKGYYKIRITHSKTIPRTTGLYIPLTTEILDLWLSTNKDKIGTDEPLINISYTHINMMLHRIGKNVLGKSIHPHLLRHSSATFYCHKLNQYQLCKRYGWAMKSNMPELYIDREGVSDEEAGDKIKEDQVSEYRVEVNRLQEQLNILESQRQDFDELIAKKVKEVLEKAQT